MSNSQILPTVIALATAISLFFGGWVFVESRFAAATEFERFRQKIKIEIQLTQQRLDQKIKTDRLQALQERLWLLQEKLGPDCGSAAHECRVIKQEIENLKRELQHRPS